MSEKKELTNAEFIEEGRKVLPSRLRDEALYSIAQGYEEALDRLEKADSRNSELEIIVSSHYEMWQKANARIKELEEECRSLEEEIDLISKVREA